MMNFLTGWKPWLVAVGVALLMMAAYQHGANVANSEWEGKWNEKAKTLAEENLKKVNQVLEVKLALEQQLEKLKNEAKVNSQKVEADAAAAADDLAERLQQQLARLESNAVNSGVAVPLPTEARQPSLPVWCQPTCSAGLIKERESWLKSLTELE